MTLQEALSSLMTRFPQDSWSAEIGVIMEKNGERVFEPLRAVGIVPIDDTFVIGLITESEINRIKQKTGDFPVPGQLSQA